MSGAQNKGKKYNKKIGHIKAEKCSWHIPHGLGILAWYHYSEDNRKKKLKQTQCSTCGYWFWPDEYNVFKEG